MAEGTLTAAQVEQIFAEYNQDPDIHFDGTTRVGGAAGLATKYTEDQLRNILSQRLDDRTDDPDTRFFGLPGKPEMWQDGDTWYAVYYIPGTNTPLLYEVAGQSSLNSFFGEGYTPVYDRQVNGSIIAQAGGIIFGTTDNIPAADGDPWAGFLARMDRAAETQPWLNVPDVFQIHAAAWLEGREVEQWELEGTSWWQDLTDAQRKAFWLGARAPEEAASQFQDRKVALGTAFLQLGMTVDDSIVDFIAQKWESGDWSQSYANTQIAALAGGANSSFSMDAELRSIVDRSGTQVVGSQYKAQEVRDEYNRWLGPIFGAVNETEAQRWATKIREQGAVAQEELVRHLQQMRMAVLPEYTDPSMSYAEIAQPWLNYGTQIWGQQLDERSGLFLQLLRSNDATEAGKLLRQAGINENIGKVTQDLQVDAFGPDGSLRRAVR
jgi:hypothetical protein